MVIRESDERAYWNALSEEYHRITRITTLDFHYGPQIPGEKNLRLLPPLHPGMTALELGCGAAQNSIWLARQGLVCTAMDLSEEQLAHAKMLVESEKVEVRFFRCAMEKFLKMIPGETFDLIHSSHAMEFVQHPDRVLKAMASALRPGGTVMVSTVHPLYNGFWIEDEIEDEAGVPQKGQFITDYFNPPDDVRDDEKEGLAVSRAYPIFQWFRWLRGAGLVLIALEEPPAIRHAPYTSDDWANHGGQLDRIPSTLILVARKDD